MISKMKWRVKRFISEIPAGMKRFGNSIIYANGITENLFVRLLLSFYDAKFQREWELSKNPPHFTDFRVLGAHFVFGDQVFGPYSFYRGFFSSEFIRNGDVVLDIGCGDGFFSRRFFVEKSSHIDAIDIDTDAIKAAQKYNPASNISYLQLDAVANPFPQDKYDVIVWDGAIGHFSHNVTNLMLEKIRTSLTESGVFVGSEALGEEGHDHLQFFSTVQDLGAIFQPYFKFVQLRSVDYKLRNSDFVRREAYWRCTNDPSRLQDAGWVLL